MSEADKWAEFFLWLTLVIAGGWCFGEWQQNTWAGYSAGILLAVLVRMANR